MPESDARASRAGLPARLAALAHEQRSRALLTLARAAIRDHGTGLHRSPLRGAGTDFADHKPYGAGDDLRMLDWRLLARSDRLVIRQVESTRSLRAEVIVDVSASMEFGTAAPAADGGSTKSEVAAIAAAILGARLLRQGDAAALSLAGRAVRGFPPRRGEPQLATWCRDVAHAVPAGGASAALVEAVTAAVTRLRRPGLVAVCTDALDEDETWLDRVAEARARGHGVMVVRVLDAAERDLPHADPAAFVGLEGETPVHAHPSRIRRLYRELFAGHVDGIRTRLIDAGVGHALLQTGRPVAVDLDSALAAPLGGKGRRWS